MHLNTTNAFPPKNKTTITLIIPARSEQKLLGVPDLTTSNKKLLGTPGLTTKNKNKKLLGTPCLPPKQRAATRGSRHRYQEQEVLRGSWPFY